MNDKMTEDLELSVVFNHDGTIRCIYLDDHRICGGKPYASEGLRFKDFKVRASAIVDIARRHEATEPKDCGFTLATCPYERCSGITMRNPRATEPLEELAKRKGAKLLEISWDSEGWHIYAQWPMIEDGDGVIPSESWSDTERVNCEAAARKFLEGLEDKGGTK